MTREDLEQIDKLLEKRFKLEFSSFKKNEIDPIHERLDAQRDQITKVEENLSMKISQEAEDIAEIIRDVIFPNIDRHEVQIAELQEVVGIKPRKH